MKNKFLKTLLTFVFCIAFGLSLNDTTVHAFLELRERTLIIHNEEPGKLLKDYLSNDMSSDMYDSIIVIGKMDESDFSRLFLISYKCKSIDLFYMEVDAIPPGFFRNRPTLEKVVLPENLKTIGALSFLDCYNLKIENLPESLEYIGNYAFQHCRSLNLTIPSKIEVGDGAFGGCNNVRILVDAAVNTTHKSWFSSIISYILSWFN